MPITFHSFSVKLIREFLFLMFFLFLGTTYAQRSCGTLHDMGKNKNEEEIISQRLAYKILDKNNKVYSKTTDDGVVIVPVVVHVLYKDETQNISDDQINSQIDVLNKDFSKQNPDFNNTPVPFKPFVADVEIQFELADYDPDGAETTGIVRKQVNFEIDSDDNKYYDENQGGSAAWDTNQYLNIWVGEFAEKADVTLLGFATFPSQVGNSFDGVAMNYLAFGTIGTLYTSFNKGRTCTHEVGHYFDLNHIWGPENSSCALADDDGIADTPNQRTGTEGTPTFPDTDLETNCPGTPPIGTGPNGTMFMNYMDYVDDVAMFMFTEDQKTRMQNSLTGPRSGLINSVGFTCLRDYYPDNDNDGLGDSEQPAIESCSPIPGYARNNYDKDDNEFIDVLVLGSRVKDRTFEINQKIGIVRTVEVYDRNGRILQLEKPNKIQPIIKLNFATPGFYYLVIKTDHSTYNKTIWLEK